jgi:hypothetical protein
MAQCDGLYRDNNDDDDDGRDK